MEFPRGMRRVMPIDRDAQSYSYYSYIVYRSTVTGNNLSPSLSFFSPSSSLHVTSLPSFPLRAAAMVIKASMYTDAIVWNCGCKCGWQVNYIIPRHVQYLSVLEISALSLNSKAQQNALFTLLHLLSIPCSPYRGVLRSDGELTALTPRP